MVKLEENNQKLANESTRRHKEANSVFQKIGNTARRQLTSVRNMVAGYVSLEGAINLVNRGMEEQNRLSEISRQTAISVADARASVIKNIGRASDEEVTDFFGKIAGIQKKLGFESQIPLLTASAPLLSATGGDRAKTLAILEEAGPFFRGASQELESFGGALADLMKNSGLNKLEDVKKATAFALAIQGQARFEKLGGFKEVAPALATFNIASGGDEFEDARLGAAIFAAFGSKSGDKTGAQTKTAIEGLSVGLKRAVGHLDTVEQRIGFVRNIQGPSVSGSTLADDIIKEVTKTGFGEGVFRELGQQFLTSSKSPIANAVRASLGEIVADEANLDRKRQQLIDLTDDLKVADINRRSEGNIEKINLAPGEADLATVREIFQQTLDKTNDAFVVGPVDNAVKKFRFGFAGSDPEDAIFLLEERLRQVRGEGGSAASIGGDNQGAKESLIKEQLILLREIRDKLNSRPSLSRNEEND